MATIPAKVDLVVWKGADFRETFQIFEDEAETAPMILTGYTIKSQVRVKAGRTEDLLAEFSVDCPTPTDGAFSISLTDGQTGVIAEKKGYYDIMLTVGDFTEPYFYGDIEFRKTATDING